MGEGRGQMDEGMRWHEARYSVCVNSLDTSLWTSNHAAWAHQAGHVLACAPVRSVSTVSTIPGIGPGRGQSSSALHTEGFR